MPAAISNSHVNLRRTGLLHVLRAMGADIQEVDRRREGGEAVADLRVRHAPLSGIEVPVRHVPDMIDEFPILAVAAACATGTTTIRGAEELRVKESDRIRSMAIGLRALGVRLQETQDGAVIHGGKLGGGVVDNPFPHGGFTGLWLGLCLELTVRGVVFAGRFFQGGWTRQRV